jgi:hypothetical protein
MTDRRQFLTTLTGALVQDRFLRAAEAGSCDHRTLLWRHFITRSTRPMPNVGCVLQRRRRIATDALS